MTLKRRSKIEDLVLHVSNTLPDSIRERRRVIGLCLDVLPPASDVRAKLLLMLTHLDNHERAQAELPLLFK